MSFNEDSIIAEFPFDSKNKLSYKHCKTSSMDSSCLFIKGAPEVLLNKSTSYVLDGNIVALDNKSRVELMNEIETQARLGLRLIGSFEKISRIF